MAKNKLTPEQDILTRQFYSLVVEDAALFPQDPVGRRQLKTIIMRLLGYTTPKQTTYKFGSLVDNDITKEWADDYARAREALNETNSSASSDEANNGQSGEGSAVRTSVLSEDV